MPSYTRPAELQQDAPAPTTTANSTSGTSNAAHAANMGQRGGGEYVVVRGDTLWDLSMKYDVSVRSLAKWNGKAPRDLLLPGEELLLFGIEHEQDEAASTIPSSHADLTQGATQATVPTPRPQLRNIVRKINYRVRSGESLASIASRFKVTVSRILEWNVHLVDRRYIHPGDPITLYVDVTNAH